MLFSHNYDYIILNYLIIISRFLVFGLVYLCIVCFTDAVSKWCRVLKITCLLFLSAAIAAAFAPSAITVIVPLTSMHASLQSHKLEFSIVVLNPIVSTQFLVLNVDG